MNPPEKLTLGSVGVLRPADEVTLCDECVRRHGHDMKTAVEASDPGRDAVGVGAIGEVNDAMDVHEPAMEQSDPLAEDLDIGVSVTEQDLNSELDL